MDTLPLVLTLGSLALRCSSIAIDHMLSLAADQNYAVAYFYFSVDRLNEQDFHRVLSSLVKQLTSQKMQLPESVERLYDDSQHGNKTLTTDQLENTLLSIAKAKSSPASRIFLIFDALDECNQGLRYQFVSLFKRMTDQGINVFVTSRPNPQEINPPPHNAVTVTLSGDGDDLRVYIQDRIDMVPVTSSLLSEPKRREEVLNTIVEYANGM
jgi:hypothetical protein